MRIILTGGPCSGKTSVINKFFSRSLRSDSIGKNSYPVIQEPARDLISFFQKYEPYNLPDSDINYFNKSLETQYIKDYYYNQIGIFDRGLVDQLAYRSYYNLDSNTQYEFVLDQCMNKIRYDKIFYFPYWEEIYTQDEIRSETSIIAKEIGELIYYFYIKCNYEVIEVPKLVIEERVQFILSKT